MKPKNLDDYDTELKDTKQLLEAVFNAIDDVIGVQDKDHRVLRYNEAGYDYVGITPTELKQRKKCFELIGKKKPCEVCATTACYTSKVPERRLKQIPEIDRWVDHRAYPILDEEGEITKVVEIVRDVTEDVRLNQKLKRSESKYRDFFDKSLVGLFRLHSESFRITAINETAASLLGGSKAEIIGNRTITDYFAIENLEEKLKLIIENPGETYTLEVEVLQPEREKIFLLSLRNYREDIAIEGALLDITEEKQLERRLNHTQKMNAIGELASGIAHDFNNILTSILGFSSLLALDLPPKSEMQENLEIIQNSAKRATQLTTELLTFAKKDQKIARIPLNLNEVIDEVYSLIRPTFSQNIEIELQQSADLKIILGDSRQIYQIVLNLCLNARDAMQDGGKITIKTNNVERPNLENDLESKSYVMLSVSDTGSGISSEVQQRLFEPFFTTKKKGRGLGLAMVYRIVQNHNGNIFFESQVGVGTTFTIHFPIITQNTQNVVVKRAVIPHGTEQLLIIEHQADIRTLMQKMLEKKGYTVIPAENGEEGINLIQKCPNTALVFLDSNLPGLPTIEVYNKLKAINPGIKVLITSAYSKKEPIFQALEEKVEAFVEKPFEWDLLFQKLRKVLDS